MKRKGLIAVVFATIATLGGGLAAQSYVWNISYTVNPLVKNTITLDLGTRSGATAITPVTITESNALKNLPKTADLKFQIFKDKDLDGDGVNDLAEVFSDWYHFKVTFEVIGTDGSTVVGSDYIEFTDANGNGAIDNGEVLQNPAVITLNPAANYDNDPWAFGDGLPVDIKWTVEGETGAVTSSVSNSIPVAIYAVEA